MIPSRRRGRFVQTSSRAWKRLWRFLLVFVPISVLFGAFRVATGSADFAGFSVRDFLVVVPIVLANLYLGAFLLAAIVGPDPEPETKRYILGWTAAGALVVPATFAIVFAVDGATGTPQGPFGSWMYWVALLLGGAVSGSMYGYHARQWRDGF